MKLNPKRVVTAAAALCTLAIAVPLSTASAATAATDPYGAGWDPYAATGWEGLPAVTFPFDAPAFGQAAVVVGPVIITTAPSSFINTNNQVSAGGNVAGGQVAGP